MKKTLFILICMLGLLSSSACRSTSSSCGLAHQKIIKQTQQNAQTTAVVIKATVK